VSHNLSAVEMMCQRTIWLDRGSVRLMGPTGDVVRAYLDAVDAALIEDGSSLTAHRFARAAGLSEGPRGPAAPLEIPQPAASEEGPATQRAVSEDKQATQRAASEDKQATRRRVEEEGEEEQQGI